jgi:hypothetical protein
LRRGTIAGFGEGEAAKKATQTVRKVIPKIENTFNVEEYARQRKARWAIMQNLIPSAS